ncbi:ComF family protein [Crossiella sp. CA-258035]|uniref:ComF family protein n=1 Tax=Crossiella sp. CA-258035 TaxID=2981138 RepID=UPI0024BC3DAD|nr:ComF family protein [Crossiella sp. CA-258035]WHT20408.1 ComF family protein [Crossiella sp. CA-258035]
MLTALLDLLLPRVCAGCRRTGTPWCLPCRARFAGLYRVRLGLPRLPPVHVVAEYSGPARATVLAYKERRRRDLAAGLGAALAAAVPRLPRGSPDSGGHWWLVPAPSRRAAARARGGSHMLRLTASIAAHLERASALPILGLDRTATDSVGLRPDERLANLRNRVHLSGRWSPPPGTPVLLVDDVVTTGATAAVCTGVLRAAGLRVTGLLALTGPPGRLEPELDPKKTLRKTSRSEGRGTYGRAEPFAGYEPEEPPVRSTGTSDNGLQSHPPIE